MKLNENSQTSESPEQKALQDLNSTPLENALGKKRIQSLASDEDDSGEHEDLSSLDMPEHKGHVKTKPEYVKDNVILSVNHLKVFFEMGKWPKKFFLKAVHDINFKIHKGEVFGLVGESGCGKSTTGRSIIGLNQITSGSIYYKGVRIAAGDRWNRKEIKWSQIKGRKEIARIKKAKSIAEVETISSSVVNLYRGKEIKTFASHSNKYLVSATQFVYNSLSSGLSFEESLHRLKDLGESFLSRAYDKQKYFFPSEEASKANGEHLLKRSEEITLDQVFDTVLPYKDLESLKASRIKTVKANMERIKKVQHAKIHQIHYDNRHVSLDLRHEIQMIFQDPIDSLDPRMTVEDTIEEGLKIKNYARTQRLKYKKQEKEEIERILADSSLSEKDKKLKIDVVKDQTKQKIRDAWDYHKKVVEVLEEVGLIPEYCSRYPHEFSGGQRQRIGIARALIMNPELLICDEPISALDVSIRAQIINLLNGLRESRNLSILFIAHDLSVVKYFCDTIAVMYFGDMVELASSDELFKHPLHPYTNSLLSAIPSPDPFYEKHRKRIHYNPLENHDYSKEKPTFQEITPGHWVLANSQEMKKYRQKMLDMDEQVEEEKEEVQSPFHVEVLKEKDRSEVVEIEETPVDEPLTSIEEEPKIEEELTTEETPLEEPTVEEIEVNEYPVEEEKEEMSATQTEEPQPSQEFIDKPSPAFASTDEKEEEKEELHLDLDSDVLLCVAPSLKRRQFHNAPKDTNDFGTKEDQKNK